MSTLKKLVLLLLMLTLMSTSAYAAEGESVEGTEESWVDKAKGYGSDALNWAKEKAPAAAETVGNVWDSGKEKLGQAHENFQDWGQRQEDEFWETTGQRIENAGGTPEATPQEAPAAEPDPAVPVEPENAEPAEEPVADGAAKETTDTAAEEAANTDETAAEEAADDDAEETKVESKDEKSLWSVLSVPLLIIVGAVIAVFAYDHYEEWHFRSGNQ